VNTTVTVKYASGAERTFVASDKLEESINEGEMFSITTMHSDMGIEEEMSLSKMFIGNPMTALGNMIMMKRNAEMMPAGDGDDETPEDHKAIIIDIITVCIKMLSDEITSHQSGMSPVEDQSGEDKVHL
jgi:hypothetical protein